MSTTTRQVSPERERFEVPKCVRCLELKRNYDDFLEMLESVDRKPNNKVREPIVHEAQYGINMWTTPDGLQKSVTNPHTYIVCADCSIIIAQQDVFNERYVGPVKGSKQSIFRYNLKPRYSRKSSKYPDRNVKVEMDVEVASGHRWDPDQGDYVKLQTSTVAAAQAAANN